MCPLLIHYVQLTVVFIHSHLLVSCSPFPVTLATVICKVYGWFDMTYNFVLVTEFSDFMLFLALLINGQFSFSLTYFLVIFL